MEEKQIPTKEERQKAFLEKVKNIPAEEAVRMAQLIPAEIVREFKVVRWPR